MSEQFWLIKQSHLFPKVQPQRLITNECTNEVIKSLLEQIKLLRGEHATKNSIISRIIKVKFIQQ